MARTTRFRGITLGLGVALGATLFLAPQAVADDQQEATQAIAEMEQSIGGPGSGDKGFTGAGPGTKEGAVTPISGTDGYKQSFSGGTIYWSEDNGARILYGAIDAKYNDEGGPAGDTAIGFPTASEGPSTVATRQASFAGEGEPTIYWSPQNGAWLVRGPFALAADRLGATLGAPTGAVTVDQVGGTVSQAFIGGTLVWNIKDGKFVDLEPLGAGFAGLTDLRLPSDWTNLGLPGVTLPGLTLPSITVPGATASDTDSDGADSDGAGWNTNWLWLLLLIPVLLALWFGFGRRRNQRVVHAPRPAADASIPKIDLKAPAATAGASNPSPASGDGIGTYRKDGASVPVPVGAHRPLTDATKAPNGYPIKGNADSGQYYAPDFPGYAETTAEIWFATESAARAAGFQKPTNS
ncbi:MAG: hypothetical protein WAW85_10335 [Gordonia sp. (in: high G+C Gram-positive bacteria)]|uniref:LGFP repeat-containing protein n=1 Tax=Gordonia sp. (in: high G+C Gram-positive bacteria) TaxID=84139 RepID=UPI003BB4C9A8